MNLFEKEDNWSENLKPLIENYNGKKHPLNYNNIYQLMIMVILSAQDSDANINKIAPKLFERYPNIQSLSISNIETLIPYITKVKNYKTKASWIIETAKIIQNEDNISLTMKDLTALKGIGRKSANVIMREAKISAEGIIVDLHVIRVTPRIGVVSATKDGNKIEKLLMQKLPKEIWGEVGMAISFLGREICRPTNPKCYQCPIKNSCQYPSKTF